MEPATIVADAGCWVIEGALALVAAVVVDDEEEEEEDESEPPLHADSSSDSEVA
ncbi:hypothetical protein HH213_13850 [Duganella dendranthematis]|uniref:Uncharacterized protein n=1 Tax=Duganella dendranthematis TaxID=2728021 RepID=A0ABX6M9R5_9BURK|nr:hypothetical protein [Duganella dendranthematis]QJD91071.1 hypothetical protein HH213_13850 [Duganella dendranthematis]